MDFKKIMKDATERFRGYSSNYDLTQPKIKLKADHTYRVASICRTIAEDEGLGDEDVFIAFMCGLLHDIGRFEQVTRFNTFYDADSVDHAHLSCEILWGTESMELEDRCPGAEPVEGIMREFVPTEDYDELIRTAIYWHSAYRYPAELSEREKMFCDIIRDADKVDIFRVNCETPLSDIHNLPEEEFKNSGITPEVFEAFMNHGTVLRALKKTAIDHVVSYIALYWELVFEKSRELAISQGYLSRLSNYKSDNIDTAEKLRLIREEIGL